jgi:hypothetical protein
MIGYENIMINYGRSLGKNEKCLKRDEKSLPRWGRLDSR